VQGAGFRVQGAGCRDNLRPPRAPAHLQQHGALDLSVCLICRGLGYRMWGIGSRVQGPGSRVQGLGFRVEGFRVEDFIG
jgi:hypothetical protein